MFILSGCDFSETLNLKGFRFLLAGQLLVKPSNLLDSAFGKPLWHKRYRLSYCSTAPNPDMSGLILSGLFLLKHLRHRRFQVFACRTWFSFTDENTPFCSVFVRHPLTC
jgi:hypothetical protein